MLSIGEIGLTLVGGVLSVYGLKHLYMQSKANQQNKETNVLNVQLVDDLGNILEIRLQKDVVRFLNNSYANQITYQTPLNGHALQGNYLINKLPDNFPEHCKLAANTVYNLTLRNGKKKLTVVAENCDYLAASALSWAMEHCPDGDLQITPITPADPIDTIQ